MHNVLAYCNFQGAKWLLFGPNVAPLVYYSHLPIVILSLFLGVYIYSQNRKNLSNKVLFFTILAFVIWVLCDSTFWASNRSDVIMFVWAMDILFEPLVYVGALYLLYTIIDKKDISFKKKLIIGLLYLPLVAMIPAGLAFSGFDINSCLSIETHLSYYSYAIEIIFTLWALTYSLVSFIKDKSSESRKKIILITIGTVLFLAAFAWGNITGSFTDDWRLGQYGLFGMPILSLF